MNDMSFRAWHNEREWMYEVTSINLKTGTLTIEYDEMSERVPMTDVTLLPFTGLVDKVGRRIYVDDIVECVFEPWETAYTSRVHISNGSIMFGPFLAKRVFDNNQFVDVIGNAFEHPERLNKNKDDEVETCQQTVHTDRGGSS